ncbi:D-2-hydroxyacid dehydrogenase [bacterium SCSIO 12741]|nr:D-2-hydroxyacid dehydrogenase [bacterium SCSIO 12741]
MKILANDGIAPSGIVLLEQAGHTVVTEKVEQDALVDAINNESYDVVLVRSATKIRQNIIDSCPGLKMIGRGGVGMDNIDVDYARSKGLKVFNTPSASSQSVAELVIAHLFSLVRMTFDSNRQMPEKGGAEFKTLKKKYGKGVELRGKTLGIVGFGRIGQNVARYALGLGMKVVAHDPFMDVTRIDVDVADQTVAVEIANSSMEEVIRQSDFVTLHVPKQQGGKAVIGSDELNSMKDGVYLINAARGGVIDEDALITALDSGKVASAALDVFENEPTPSEALMAHPKIALTPHVGAATLEAQSRIGEELANFIISNS